jgi:hypothetical protein
VLLEKEAVVNVVVIDFKVGRFSTSESIAYNDVAESYEAFTKDDRLEFHQIGPVSARKAIA